jgi:Zn-dependent M28 family amino/carboxypeptidase
MRIRLKLAFALAVVAVPLAGSASATAAATDTSKLRSAVTLKGVMTHVNALQEIADENGGTRASGTPGYDASAAYVARRLRRAGYNVSIQPFTFPFFDEVAPAHFERVSPDPRVYVRDTDFSVMEYSGSGDTTASIVPTNDIVIPPGATANTSTSGCEAADFPASVAGNVALIQRGTCTFGEKAQNAQAAGASAAIIFNEGQPGRTGIINGTLGGPAVTIPVLDTTFAVGEELYSLDQSGDVVVHVSTSTISETRTTTNVITQTASGRSDRVVAVGAHLDSVPEGPGINDNGTGSAVALEIAVQMARLGIKPTNQVRFAWFGAEENGLLGSEFYVNSLSRSQRKDIALNINLDMIGSTNYVRFVYDGDGSDSGIKGPAGSATIEDVFLEYFDSQGLATDPTPLSGSSDYASFSAVGIPVGGLFAGASDLKTEEQAAIYGGVAGQPYHACYHLACDTASSINTTVLDQMADASAHATLVFGMTSSDVSGTDSAADATQQNQELKGPRARR